MSKRTVATMSNRMDEYYKTAKFFSSIVGIWPYQNPSFARVLNYLFILFIGVFGLTQVLAVYKHLRDLELMIQVLYSLVATSSCLIKVYISMRQMPMIVSMLDQVSSVWATLSANKGNNAVMEVLDKIEKRGGMIGFTYAVALWLTGGPILVYPFFIAISEIVHPLNETREKFTVFVGEYIVDQDTYYLYIVIFQFICILSMYSGSIAYDVLYVNVVHHACGLFDIVRFRFTELFKEYQLNGRSKSKDEIISKQISDIVAIHIRAIQFSNNLQAVYSIGLLFTVGHAMLLMSLTGIQALVKMDDFGIGVAAMFLNDLIMQIFGLLYISYPAQLLTDRSAGVYKTVYSLNWYSVSVKNQKLLAFVMLRSLVKPCLIKAGNIYVMGLQNFANVVKTSVTYFTVLSSLR